MMCPKLIESSQVMKLLGISRSTLFRWSGLGELGRDDPSFKPDMPRPFKLGRKFKWDRNELNDWVSNIQSR